MRRGSVTRLMAVVVLTALALTEFLEWLGPSNWYGFLGLLYVVVLIAGIGWLLIPGSLGRFCAGFGAACVVIWVAAGLSPALILDRFCCDEIIVPIHDVFFPVVLPGPGRPHFPLPLGISFRLAQGYRDGEFNRYKTLSAWVNDRAFLYGHHRELQGLLLIPLATLATIGGFIGVAIRPRRHSPPSPPPAP
jgi:hypothetical protein